MTTPAPIQYPIRNMGDLKTFLDILEESTCAVIRAKAVADGLDADEIEVAVEDQRKWSRDLRARAIASVVEMMLQHDNEPAPVVRPTGTHVH